MSTKAKKPVLRTTRPEKGLTPKQETFCRAYVTNGGNASDAYRAAYDIKVATPVTVNRKAKELIDNGKIAARIAEIMEANATVATITDGQVLAEAARIGLCDPGELFDEAGDLIPIHLLPAHVRAAIASVEIEERKADGEGVKSRLKKIKLWDKNSALEKLMKHLGMFEKDNKQRAGIFDQLPKGEVERIVERLRAINRPSVAGEPVSTSASRFTH